MTYPSSSSAETYPPSTPVETDALSSSSDIHAAAPRGHLDRSSVTVDAGWTFRDYLAPCAVAGRGWARGSRRWNGFRLPRRQERPPDANLLFRDSWHRTLSFILSLCVSTASQKAQKDLLMRGYETETLSFMLGLFILLRLIGCGAIRHRRTVEVPAQIGAGHARF